MYLQKEELKLINEDYTKTNPTLQRAIVYGEQAATKKDDSTTPHSLTHTAAIIVAYPNKQYE